MKHPQKTHTHTVGSNIWAKSTKKVILKKFPQNFEDKNWEIEVMSGAKIEKNENWPPLKLCPPFSSEDTSLKHPFLVLLA